MRDDLKDNIVVMKESHKGDVEHLFVNATRCLALFLGSVTFIIFNVCFVLSFPSECAFPKAGPLATPGPSNDN